MKRPMFMGEVVVAVRPRKDCGHWFEHGAVVELTRSGPLGSGARGRGRVTRLDALGRRLGRGKDELVQILRPDEFRPFYDEE